MDGRAIQLLSGFAGAFLLIGFAQFVGVTANAYPQIGCFGFLVGNIVTIGIIVVVQWLSSLRRPRY